MSYQTTPTWRPGLDLPPSPCECFWCGNGPEGSEIYCKNFQFNQEANCPLPTLQTLQGGFTTGEWQEASPISKRNKLLNFHHALTLKARGVMEKKNQDYGEDGDPFRNFRGFGAFGILVRLSDKLSRLRTFVERGTYMVNDEAVDDTTMDAINYLVLLLAMLKEKEVFNEAEDVEVSPTPRSGGTLR